MTPIRVAAVNDYELVVEGVAALLRRFPDRLVVCERIVIGEPLSSPVDVALYDTYGRTGEAGDALRTLRRSGEIRHLAIFSLDFRPELIAAARAEGVSGFLSKSLPALTIADSLVDIAAGNYVELTGVSGDPSLTWLEWPGKADGLSERESQVLVLCSEGLTNREIATELYIGVETVKSHLRTVFAKLGLRNRVQAAQYVHATGAFARYPSTPSLSA